MTRTCDIQGCKKPYLAKGLCAMHYQRKRTTGVPGTAELLRVPGVPGRKRKACTICREVRPLDAFYSDKRTLDGKGSQCRECFGKRNSVNRRRRIYGIDPNAYAEMLDKADGRCEACGRESTRLVVDHCHRTGQVRGLLCDPCNTTLGQMADDIAHLRALIKYIEERGT